MTDNVESRFDAEFEGELPASADEAAIRRMETAAYILDEGVRVPGVGVRIGVDPILGVLPVAGDVVSGALSMYIVAESAYLGVSFATLLKMLATITIDVAGGSIPYLGTVVDVFWKANSRNVELALGDLAETVATDGGAEAGVGIPVESEE